jgi:hypothetical protein
MKGNCMAYHAIEIEPLSPIIRAEVSGVDISKLLDEKSIKRTE